MNPYESEGNSYGGESNDFNTTLTLAKNAKEKGMRKNRRELYRLYSARRTIETDGYTNTPTGWKVCWKMELIPCLPG